MAAVGIVGIMSTQLKSLIILNNTNILLQYYLPFCAGKFSENNCKILVRPFLLCCGTAENNALFVISVLTIKNFYP